MLKITLLAAVLGLTSSQSYPVTQEQLAQYVAAAQTSGQSHSPRAIAISPRPRQAYAVPPQYQAEDPEPQPQPQYVSRVAPSSSAYYQQTRQPPVQLDESQLQALRKLRPSAERPRTPEEDYDPNPAYQFSFDVKDDEFTNYQNRKEQREGDKISGSYSIVDSDGYIRTVTYTADPLQGFKAEVSREPTDIKVKLPTPPTPVAQQYQQVPQRVQYQPQPQYRTQAVEQPDRELARKQQTQQYLEATRQLDLPQQYSLRPQSPSAYASIPQPSPQAYLQAGPQRSAQEAGLSAYVAPHRLASPKTHKAAAIGYATQPSTASPILYQAYQQ